MFYKYISLLIIINFSLFASNKAFDNDIKKYLEKDFYKYGIIYDNKNSKIIFSETEMLFQNGNTNLRKPFEMIIDGFFPRYLEILKKHKINIKEVYILGHSSSQNRNAQNDKEKFYLNKILSQKRADSFFKYTLTMKNKYVNKNLPWIKEVFITKGMSSSNLIYDKKGNEDISASRRIELQVFFHKKLKETSKNFTITESDNGMNKNTLTKYVKKLLEQNPSLQEKYELLKSFESDIDKAKALFKPTVSLNLRYDDYIKSEPDDFTYTQSGDITMRYNIFNGFKDIEELNIQKYNYKSNKYLNEQVEIDLIYSLAEAFMNIQKQNDILKLAQNNLNDYDLWISKENIKFQNGMVSLRNYATIQSRDTTQRMNYRELKKQYRDNISTFKRYLDFQEQDVESFENLNPQSKYINDKTSAYYDLNTHSPYVKQSNEIVAMYQEKLQQAKVNFYPTVNLIAKRNRLDENYERIDTEKTNETSIAIEASLELYSGGKDKANYEKIFFEYKSKQSKQADIKRDVKYKLDLAFNNYELSLEKENFLQHLIKKRENALLGASYDYKFAKISADELLDNVDDLYSAKKMYIENKYNKLLNKYKILNVVGTLKNTILKDENKDEN